MNAEVALDEIVERFLELHRLGRAPDVYTFAEQYPKFRSKLEGLLPLVLQMEGYAEERMPREEPEWEMFPDLGNTDYQLLRKIGSGGMGVVYEAQQLSLNRKVALKVLASSVADRQRRMLLENEARVIAMLHHPNIVKVYSAELSSERCYYAMELIEGKGVDTSTFNDLRRIAEIGLQTAKALAYAHSCNVLHRDIKPANLLLDANGDVHVSDFGLAFILQTPTGLQEGEHARHGTIRYMAPERIANGINTFAGDQYSFGVTLYEMVTHQPVLVEPSTKALMDRILEGPLPPLKCVEPDLAAIINKCIAFHPEDRYASMDAVIADLQCFLEHKVVSAAPASLFRRFCLWLKRKPAVATLSFLGLLLFFAFVVTLVVGYLRVNTARNLAEQNAEHANATLVDIFYHIERQTPTTAGTELLARLMPYYQAIAQQKKTSSEQLINAYQIIGTAAVRSGNDAIAEKAFRSLIALQPSAYAMNQLAEALKRQCKHEEAQTVYRALLAQYPTSSQAVYALQSLEQFKEAFELLHQQLQVDPTNPELRFLYAQLLGRHAPPPRSKKKFAIHSQAIILLNDLVEEYPDRPEYGIELMEMMSRKLKHARQLSLMEQEELTLALTASYRLLGRFPNTPGVFKSVVALHRAYVMHLHRTRQRPAVRQEVERLQGMLELLSHNPDVSDTVKELLQTIKTNVPSPPPDLRNGQEGPPRP